MNLPAELRKRQSDIVDMLSKQEKEILQLSQNLVRSATTDFRAYELSCSGYSSGSLAKPRRVLKIIETLNGAMASGASIDGIVPEGMGKPVLKKQQAAVAPPGGMSEASGAETKHTEGADETAVASTTAPAAPTINPSIQVKKVWGAPGGEGSVSLFSNGK